MLLRVFVFLLCNVFFIGSRRLGRGFEGTSLISQAVRLKTGESDGTPRRSFTCLEDAAPKRENDTGYPEAQRGFGVFGRFIRCEIDEADGEKVKPESSEDDRRHEIEWMIVGQLLKVPIKLFVDAYVALCEELEAAEKNRKQ